MIKFHVALERERSGVRDIVDSVFRIFEDVGGVEIPKKHVEGAPCAVIGSDVHFYVEQSLDRSRGQVDVQKYEKLLRQGVSDMEDLHFMLTILNTDAFAPETNFVFGNTMPLFTHAGGLYGWEMDLHTGEMNFAPSVTIST